jgi:hypothetical protein
MMLLLHIHSSLLPRSFSRNNKNFHCLTTNGKQKSITIHSKTPQLAGSNFQLQFIDNFSHLQPAETVFLGNFLRLGTGYFSLFARFLQFLPHFVAHLTNPPSSGFTAGGIAAAVDGNRFFPLFRTDDSNGTLDRSAGGYPSRGPAATASANRQY